MNDLFDLVIKLISLIKWVWDKGWTYQKHTQAQYEKDERLRKNLKGTALGKEFNLND